MELLPIRPGDFPFVSSRRQSSPFTAACKMPLVVKSKTLTRPPVPSTQSHNFCRCISKFQPREIQISCNRYIYIYSSPSPKLEHVEFYRRFQRQSCMVGSSNRTCKIDYDDIIMGILNHSLIFVIWLYIFDMKSRYSNFPIVF